MRSRRREAGLPEGVETCRQEVAFAAAEPREGGRAGMGTEWRSGVRPESEKAALRCVARLDLPFAGAYTNEMPGPSEVSTASTRALSPVLDHWKELHALPDLTVDEQYAYAEEVGTLVLWLHSDELIRELASEAGAGLDEILFLLGRHMLRLGDPAGATDLFSRASEALAAGPRRLGAIRHLNALGNCWYELERLDRSEDAYRRGLAILVAREPTGVRLAVLQNNLATCLASASRFDEAEHYFLESIRTVEAASDGDVANGLGSLESAMTRKDLVGGRIHNLGELYMQRSREADGPEEARRLRREADRRFREALGYYDRSELRFMTLLHRAEVAALDGRVLEADSALASLELTALQTPALHGLLPGVYLRRALASKACDALEDALLHCRRALTSSLVHGHRVEERLVIETFLDTLAAAKRRDEAEEETPPEQAGGLARSFRERYGDVVDDLVAFLGRKDWYTGRAHSLGVANLSTRVGEAILEEDPSAPIDLEVLSLAAILHDIGKLHVPWALLNKILPVRRDELPVLRSHAIEGYNILRKLGLGPLAEVAGEHHERLDGRGYPFGKTAPTLMGNVVAIADTFEAMTTINRRWRPAKGKGEAIPEIVGLEGSWFYPKVVRGLVRAIG
jgi:HD-GYP domain-containing protein (c-di-GMP phosphodiesterase class II)